MQSNGTNGIQKPLFGDRVFSTSTADAVATIDQPAPATAPRRVQPAAKPARSPKPAADASDVGARIASLFAELAPAPALDADQVRDIVNTELTDTRETIRSMADRLETIAQPRADHFNVTAGAVTRKIDGRAHAAFAQILATASSRNRRGFHPNILIKGPAGSGKTHLCAQLAQALAYEFRFISLSAGLSEAHLIGRYIPTGAAGAFEYVPAAFVRAYRDGGLFLLDELDAADGNVMVAVNSALANGHMTLPNGDQVKRHPDSIIIGAVNTWGHGADRQYAGRNQLDAATLDRFAVCKFTVDYDEEFERDSARADVVEWFHQVRRTATGAGLRRIVSTRAILDASDLVDAGAATLDDVKTRFLADWTDQERAKLLTGWTE